MRAYAVYMPTQDTARPSVWYVECLSLSEETVLEITQLSTRSGYNVMSPLVQELIAGVTVPEAQVDFPGTTKVDESA